MSAYNVLPHYMKQGVNGIVQKCKRHGNRIDYHAFIAFVIRILSYVRSPPGNEYGAAADQKKASQQVDP